MTQDETIPKFGG